MTYAGAYKNYARIPDVLELPRLSEMQLRSFEWFRKEGLAELLARRGRPIADTKRQSR